MTGSAYTPEELAFMNRHTVPYPTPKTETAAPVGPSVHPLAGRTPGVRSTSRKALKTVKVSDDEATVFTVLKMHDQPMCDREILDYCRKYTDKGGKWDINQVNGRRNGLLKKGLIEETPRHKCAVSTVVPVIHWKVVAEAEG